MRLMDQPESVRIAPHASRRLYGIWLGIGVLLAVIGAATIVLGEGGLLVAVGAAYLLLGGGAIPLGLWGRSAGAAVQITNTAFNEMTKGALGRAERLLNCAEQTSRTKLVRRVIHVQRAVIAMRRGDVDGAVAHCDAAIAVPVGPSWAGKPIQLVHAQAIRGLLRAARGDRDAARADIEAVRTSDNAAPEALARSALAEAILFERAGDRAALRALLEEQHELCSRDRTRASARLSRAYQRMLRATSTSITGKAPHARLRRPRSHRSPTGWRPSLPARRPSSGWRSRAAATHSTRPSWPIGADGASPPRGRRRARGGCTLDPRSRSLRLRLAIAFVLMCVGFLALFQLIGQDADGVPVDSFTSSTSPVTVMSATVIAVFVGLFASIIARQRRQARKLLGATVLLGRGDLDGAERELAPLARSRLDLVAAQALLSMSAIASKRADFEGALAHCDQALGRLTRYASRVAASDILLPELHAQRAFVLAVSGATTRRAPSSSRSRPGSPATRTSRAPCSACASHSSSRRRSGRAARLVDQAPAICRWPLGTSCFATRCGRRSGPRRPAPARWSESRTSCARTPPAAG